MFVFRKSLLPSPTFKPFSTSSYSRPYGFLLIMSWHLFTFN